MDETAKIEIAEIDRALDEVLVHLGGLVLRLSGAKVTKTREAHQALVQSVNQYSVCAVRSADPRVQRLKAELQKTIQPQLRLVVSR
jgi:hypothetical protein